jgi:hypothetical protein
VLNKKIYCDDCERDIDLICFICSLNGSPLNFNIKKREAYLIKDFENARLNKGKYEPGKEPKTIAHVCKECIKKEEQIKYKC